jgi:hypothetical protein
VEVYYKHDKTVIRYIYTYIETSFFNATISKLSNIIRLGLEGKRA